jgi:two-component system, NarL family, response regulator DesR
MNTRPTAAQSQMSSSSSLTATKIRVLFVDDNQDLSTILRMVIDSEPDMRCVGSLASADTLVAEVRRLCTQAPPPTPDVATPLVVILDATMPGKDPLEAMRELAAALPQVRTIIYSGHDDPGFIERVIGAGAWGCVSKRHEPAAITRAVREVCAGRIC